MFLKSRLKVAKTVFVTKFTFFKIAIKVTKYLGHFCTKICHQGLSKVAQSGHTEYNEWQGQSTTTFCCCCTFCFLSIANGVRQRSKSQHARVCCKFPRMFEMQKSDKTSTQRLHSELRKKDLGRKSWADPINRFAHFKVC